MRERGRFIVFEGLDGAGSTTQLGLLARWLAERQVPVQVTREPSSGPIGAVIRQALERRLELDAATLALAFAADRLDHLHNPQTGVLRSLEAGWWVLSDRYVLSSLAYQQASGLSLAWLREINRQALPPDLTIFIDTSPERCLERIRARSAVTELFEEAASISQVAERYRQVLGLPEVTGECLEVDGNGTPDEVFQGLLRAFTGWLEARGIVLSS